MNLQTRYKKEIVPRLKEELKVGSVMAVPRVLKVTLNVGAKEALTDKKILQVISDELAIISGQRPVITKAKTSISTFKLRAGDSIGVTVTMRGKRMYDFLEKFVAIVLPRVKDFRGISTKAFDGHGNYSIGFREQIVFPEIETGKIDRTRPLQVVITTSAKDDDSGWALLNQLGFPFQKS